jgi:hypothetical protein
MVCVARVLSTGNSDAQFQMNVSNEFLGDRQHDANGLADGGACNQSGVLLGKARTKRTSLERASSFRSTGFKPRLTLSLCRLLRVARTRKLLEPWTVLAMFLFCRELFHHPTRETARQRWEPGPVCSGLPIHGVDHTCHNSLRDDDLSALFFNTYVGTPTLRAIGSIRIADCMLRLTNFSSTKTLIAST